jgi:hypothetical protein
MMGLSECRWKSFGIASYMGYLYILRTGRFPREALYRMEYLVNLRAINLKQCESTLIILQFLKVTGSV